MFCLSAAVLHLSANKD